MRFSNKEFFFSKSGLSIANFYNEFHSFLIEYPSTYNINYFWNYGFLSGFFLVLQIITGIVLAMHYTPEINFAFFSVDSIMRDVSSGWILRYLHLNGASMFFICIYIHLLKGLYYNSYRSPRGWVWLIGLVIYFFLMGTAFLGYVLPWGQMSYWAATVITNFVTVIPFIGKDLIVWLWGGFSINNATLNRFFSLHYLLPFIIVGLVLLHLLILHQYGSNNPSGFVSQSIDTVSFYPYSYIKDFLGSILFMIFFFFLVFFFPEFLNHSDNYIEANPLNTPNHIVPEWYFLPFYAILRSISNKVQGIIVMFLSIILLSYLIILEKFSYLKSNIFKTFHKKLFWFFFFNLIFLGYIGSQFPVSPYVELGLICTHLHLLYFVFFVPFFNYILNLFSFNNYYYRGFFFY